MSDANEVPYVVTDIIQEISTGTEEHPGKFTVLKQKRRRDDGTYTREFISIKCEMGKKVFFFPVPVASDLISGLTSVIDLARDEDARLRKSWESNFRQDHQDNSSPGSSYRGRERRQPNKQRSDEE